MGKMSELLGMEREGAHGSESEGAQGSVTCWWLYVVGAVVVSAAVGALFGLILESDPGARIVESIFIAIVIVIAAIIGRKRRFGFERG